MEAYETRYGTIDVTLKNHYVKVKERAYGGLKINKIYKVSEEFMGVPLNWHVVVEQINQGNLNRMFLHYVTLEGIDGYFEARNFEIVKVKKRANIFSRIKRYIIHLNDLNDVH
jgi:hypothetical protein